MTKEERMDRKNTRFDDDVDPASREPTIPIPQHSNWVDLIKNKKGV